MEAELRTINPWWREKKVSNELAKPYRREIFAESLKLMKYRQILILTGLRRVGKSTVMFQMIEELLKDTEAERILYFSFDLAVEDVMTILSAYKELTNVEWEKQGIFVFFDEIQKLDGWASKLKLLYDNFPRIKFIVSGSSSVSLEKEAISTLTGRYFITHVRPLDFKEFLELKKSKIDIGKLKVWEREIKREFNAYLKRPFPEIVEWESDLLIKKYLRESVIDKIMRKDLPTRFRDVNEDLLDKLIDIFYSEPGMYLNYDHLASDLKVSKKTLVSHIFYLEFAYLIRRIKNFRSRSLTASKKLQRIYPYHWSLLFPVREGDVHESFVATLTDARYYWRKDGKEVDFIIRNKDLIPLEVKGGNARKEDLASLAFFCRKNNIRKAFVIHGGDERREKIGPVAITFLPFWKFALEKPFRQEE